MAKVAKQVEVSNVAVETEAATPTTEVKDEKSAAELIAEFGTKSNAIRALSASGKPKGEIAKILGIRYQHVRNVLAQPLKRVIKAERDAAKVEPATSETK